jgi:hypothetical protein
LEWRVGIFVVAAVLGLAGMYLDESWLTGAAILLLVAGVLLRFVPGSPGAGDPADGEDEDAREAP